MKKIAIIISIVCSLIILTPFGIFGFVKYKLYSIEKETRNYLLEKYDEDEIIEIEAYMAPGHMFYASVVFKDEKNIYYDYTKVDGKIRQVPSSIIDNYDYKYIEEYNRD